jgi:hypothetical protein
VTGVYEDLEPLTAAELQAWVDQARADGCLDHCETREVAGTQPFDRRLDGVDHRQTTAERVNDDADRW